MLCESFSDLMGVDASLLPHSKVTDQSRVQGSEGFSHQLPLVSIFIASELCLFFSLALTV